MDDTKTKKPRDQTKPRATIVETLPNGTRVMSDGSHRNAKGQLVKGGPSIARNQGRPLGSKNAFRKKVLAGLDHHITSEVWQELTETATKETPTEVFKLLAGAALKEQANINVNVNGEGSTGFYATAPIPEKETSYNADGLERLDHEANQQLREQFLRSFTFWLEQRLDDYYSTME